MQPAYIQDALYKNNTDAHAAARALDLYKADTGRRKTTTRSQQQPRSDEPPAQPQASKAKRNSAKAKSPK